MESKAKEQTSQKGQALPATPSADVMKLEAVAELVQDGLFIFDRNGALRFVSRAGANLLGYSREAMTGFSISDLLSPQSRQLFDELWRRVLDNPGVRLTESIMVMPSWKKELEIEMSLLAPVAGGDTYLLLKDISLSRLMEKELLKSNKFLRNIIMNSVDGIIASDISGNILIFNQGASRMLGWMEQEVIGQKKLEDFLESGTAEEILMRLRRDDPRDGPACLLNPLEVTIVHKSGERIPAHLSASSVFEDNREVAVVGIFADLRERVAMERTLMETRDYLKNVMENASDMIITTDLDTKIVSINRGGERMMGYSRDEVLGKSVEMLWASPNERRTLMRRVEHFDGAVNNYETKLRHKNGTLVDISLTLSLLTNNAGQIVGTVGISKDITAQKRAQAELQETKDYLNNILENTPDMIITTDLDNDIVSFNKGAERILGYSREEVMGRNIEDLYKDPGERQALAMVLSGGEAGAAVNYETQLTAKEGHVVDIDLTLSYLRNNRNETIGTVGISKDITEKKRVEAELEQKKAELEAAQMQIMHNEKMASLGKLATSVAHEINNPLGGILLFCEMILEELEEDDPHRSDLMQIKEQTTRCRDIVKGLLEFGRMTGTHYSFIDLNRTVEQGISLFANQAIFQNIEIVRDLDPNLPQIMGDASQLNQVFTNLIINAVDAMNGQGTLTLKTFVDYEAEEVLVQFGDTGKGVDPEILPRLFEPFFTTKPVGEGVGLGLSTSYGIVKKHNGLIEVESELGCGTTFTVHLPLEGPDLE